MNINLHIERLVLDGLPLEPRHRAQLQAALQQELARLLAAGRLPPGFGGGGAMPAVKAPPMHFQHGVSAAGLGRQIAAAVYGGFEKGASPASALRIAAPQDGGIGHA